MNFDSEIVFFHIQSVLFLAINEAVLFMFACHFATSRTLGTQVVAIV